MSEDSGTARSEFDLTELAGHADLARRFRVGLNRGQIGIGIALVVIGTYFLLDPPPGSIPPFSSGPALFIAFGVVIVGVGGWVRMGLAPSPRKLIVSADSIDFLQIPRQRNIRVRWNDSRFALDLYDFRGIRAADPKSRSKGYDFLIQSGNGPETAVPKEAFDAVLRIAESRGSLLTEREVSIGAKAPMVVTTIRNPR